MQCPEFIEAPENVTVLPDETVNFYCLAFSHGGLLYDWKVKKGSIPLTAIESYDPWQYSTLGQTTTINNLTMMNTKESDEGWYCCMVTNECGSVQECAWLEVDSKLNVTHTLVEYDVFVYR